MKVSGAESTERALVAKPALTMVPVEEYDDREKLSLAIGGNSEV